MQCGAMTISSSHRGFAHFVLMDTYICSLFFKINWRFADNFKKVDKHGYFKYSYHIRMLLFYTRLPHTWMDEHSKPLSCPGNKIFADFTLDCMIEIEFRKSFSMHRQAQWRNLSKGYIYRDCDSYRPPACWFDRIMEKIKR